MKIKLRRTVLNLVTISVFILVTWHFGLLRGLGIIMVPEEEVGVGNQKGIHAPKEERDSVFKREFYFPQPRVMKSVREIEDSPWLLMLRRYLDLPNRSLDYVYLLTSNFKYIDVLLNWLISAVVRSNVSVHDILIISMDYSTHELLTKKKFHSIFVSPSFIFSHTFNFSQPFDEVMMLRLALMRIINHLGVSVAMFDTDAIMLKNPNLLFARQADADIIGSVGTIPDDLFEEWGVTICIGMVLVKSSEKTETYWNVMKDLHQECVDDQGKLNYGLKALDIKWHSNSNHQSGTVYGQARNDLHVNILPYDDICRLDTCVSDMRARYYVWHKGGYRTRRTKLHSARDGRVWFLRYKWDNIHNQYVGKEWLRSIAYLGVTMEH